jgi:hypothetical protein
MVIAIILGVEIAPPRCPQAVQEMGAPSGSTTRSIAVELRTEIAVPPTGSEARHAAIRWRTDSRMRGNSLAAKVAIWRALEVEDLA